ncbi:MAG: homocysteine S-methyltransferase [Acidobacteria bacterium]|nr:homocysteine S-methyltransferase [Acidobacteriota bacterium]
MGTPDPLKALLDAQGLIVLDGGLATELEARGHDLSDALWSARLLLDAPEAIRDVHASYLEAGADCVVTGSYQATVEGFRRRGVGVEEARRLLVSSVDLACQARDAFWQHAPPGRLRPLVGASVGPYGAALADGSEYVGRYDLDEAGLLDFHRERFALLAASGADLLACETLPSRAEARVLLRLLDETPGVRAWFSFTARDAGHVSDGAPLAEVVRELDHERVVGIGVNCVPPVLVPGLLAEVRHATGRPLVAYPNSGERWNASARAWEGAPGGSRPEEACSAWREAGAVFVGGCCRVGPAAIARMRRRLLG